MQVSAAAPHFSLAPAAALTTLLTPRIYDSNLGWRSFGTGTVPGRLKAQPFSPPPPPPPPAPPTRPGRPNRRALPASRSPALLKTWMAVGLWESFLYCFPLRSNNTHKWKLNTEWTIILEVSFLHWPPSFKWSWISHLKAQTSYVFL